MSKSQSSKDQPTSKRLEKILGGMFAGLLIASVLSILSIVVFAATGMNNAIAIVVVFPMIGLPAAAVLLLSLVVVRMVNAKRQ